MNKKVLLLVIIVFSVISRLWMIDNIPPFVQSSVLYLRIISAWVGIGIIFLVFIYAQKLFKNVKIALLSSWVYAILPWTIEQSRISSHVEIALFVLFVFLIVVRNIKIQFFKAIVFLLVTFCVYLSYPEFWIFKINNFSLNLNNYLNNFFLLISPEFLFFKNITFWWGGVREYGIIYISLLPFFILGLYKFLINIKLEIFFLMAAILIVSATSPYFPESREFFFITPLISLLVGLGIYHFFTKRNFLVKFVYLFIFLFVVYDLAGFFHYFVTHYPQQILSNVSQINEPF